MSTGSCTTHLEAAEHNECRRPFVEPDHRSPTLTWPREIPLTGEPADVVAIVQAYADWPNHMTVGGSPSR